MKKSVRRVLIIVMAMMCCLLVTVPVPAAKKPSMKTVTRTYRKFLKKHIWNSSRYTSQGETTDTLVDINKDGVPELVLSSIRMEINMELLCIPIKKAKL
ncbi:MAG: hypothetical protein ACLURP_13615 [Ruminococcus sp.]